MFCVRKTVGAATYLAKAIVVTHVIMRCSPRCMHSGNYLSHHQHQPLRVPVKKDEVEFTSKNTTGTNQNIKWPQTIPNRF